MQAEKQNEMPDLDEFEETKIILITGGLPMLQNLTGVDVLINDKVTLEAGKECKIGYILSIKYKGVSYILSKRYQIKTEKLKEGRIVLQKPPFNDKWFKLKWNNSDFVDTVAKLEPDPEAKPTWKPKKFMFTNIDKSGLQG
ncbi:hypothetical protein H0H92_003582 [Tricholoma furcatifolium]|nr:hypothetical protein H0H92_003582 [Tricholoma furcatifolium]